MGCSIEKTASGATIIMCGGGKTQRRCHYCTRMSTKLCDFPVGDGLTCDRRLCGQCAVSKGPDKDECRLHDLKQESL